MTFDKIVTHAADDAAPTDEHSDLQGEYLYRRAEQELAHAQRAEHPAVVRAHYALANLYLDQLYDQQGITSGG